MSAFSKFMKQNKILRENTGYPATKFLIDENGEPLKWIIKPLTSKEYDNIRDQCTYDVPVTGKPNMIRPKVNTSKLLVKLICASVVEPNLNDKQLQDSYGVMSAEELIQEMIDDPSEYSDFAAFIQEFNGFTTLEEKVEEAKN